MAHIFVSPVSLAYEAVWASGAGSLLTFVELGDHLSDLMAAGVQRHEMVTFADITEPRDGYILAGSEHVERIIQFVSTWNRESALLILCYAGISRSTAAAYIAACALMPNRDEEEIAAELRSLSPSATPNIHLIGLADDILGRSGRMTTAIRAIGRGADAFEGEVFSLEIPDRKGQPT